MAYDMTSSFGDADKDGRGDKRVFRVVLSPTAGQTPASSGPEPPRARRIKGMAKAKQEGWRAVNVALYPSACASSANRLVEAQALIRA